MRRPDRQIGTVIAAGAIIVGALLNRWMKMSIDEREPEDEGREDGHEATAYRCSICSTNWPPAEDFEECPECGEDTSPFFHASPIEDDEANRRLAYARWEEWQVENDRV